MTTISSREGALSQSCSRHSGVWLTCTPYQDLLFYQESELIIKAKRGKPLKGKTPTVCSSNQFSSLHSPFSLLRQKSAQMCSNKILLRYNLLKCDQMKSLQSESFAENLPGRDKLFCLSSLMSSPPLLQVFIKGLYGCWAGQSVYRERC